MPDPLDDSDCDSVKLIESSLQTQSTAMRSMAAESRTGLPNFHPPETHEDSLGETEGAPTEDLKSMTKKRKRNKRKKKTRSEAKHESHSVSETCQEDLEFTPLKNKIPDSFFDD